MANKDRRLYVRITEDERKRSLALADSLGLTVSGAVRKLLRLANACDAETESRHAIAIDGASFTKLVREARIWGYQYNQIAHKLNRITYYLRQDMADAADVLEELQGIEKMLDKANEEIASLRAEAERLSSMHAVRK